MSDPSDLFAKNRAWATDIKKKDPDFFHRLARAQHPEYMWIGCSDSRVPANQILGLIPGEVFVHRNIANVVVHTDLNCLSVLQFAVDNLKVRHVLVVGHYGCGGIAAALANRRLGLIDNWLRHIQDVHHKHVAYLESQPADQRADRLCELNVIEQVVHACETTIIQDAWHRGQELYVHGWTYALEDGIVRDLKLTVSSADGILPAYKSALRHMQNTGGKIIG